MTIKYREGEFGSLADNKDIGRRTAMTRLERHLRPIGDADYRIRRPGEQPGPQRSLPQAMELVRNMTKQHSFPGYKVSVKSDSEGATAYGLLLVDPVPPITNTPGNAFVDLVYTMVFAKFPQASNLGNVYCRRIDGSYSWSQHAFGNAQDFGAPSGPQFWPHAECHRQLPRSQCRPVQGGNRDRSEPHLAPRSGLAQLRRRLPLSRTHRWGSQRRWHAGLRQVRYAVILVLICVAYLAAFAIVRSVMSCP